MKLVSAARRKKILNFRRRVDGKDPCLFFCHKSANLQNDVLVKIKELKNNVDKQCYSYCTTEIEITMLQLPLLPFHLLFVFHYSVEHNTTEGILQVQ